MGFGFAFFLGGGGCFFFWGGVGGWRSFFFLVVLDGKSGIIEVGWQCLFASSLFLKHI